MMHFVSSVGKTTSPSAPAWTQAQVAVTLDDHCYLLDDGRLARQAASCLLVPEPGDRVLSVASDEGELYIVHVLDRADTGGSAETDASLNVPGARQLTIRQPRIALAATEQISIHALHDVDVTAATGNLSLNARNLFATVHDSLVQNVRHYIGKAEQYLLDARQLLKLHGGQTLVTAEQDVKVDGERISMG
jgi:hypothetical protein